MPAAYVIPEFNAPSFTYPAVQMLAAQRFSQVELDKLMLKERPPEELRACTFPRAPLLQFVVAPAPCAGYSGTLFPIAVMPAELGWGQPGLP